MTSPFVEQLADMRRQIATLEQQRVTYRAATVTAVNAVASTFDAAIQGADDVLSGIPAEPAFLPAVGDVVRLSLSGATPIYQPHRIGENAIGYTELDPAVVSDIAAGGGGATDTTVPKAPTALTLTTVSVQSTKGQASATVGASWTAPTQNTDNSSLTDLAHYLVEFRWQGRAPQWDTRSTTETSIDLTGLAGGLPYDVRVAAVDTSGHVSAWTAVATVTTAVDTTPPAAPSTPVVTPYLGQLRIAWDGKTSTGAAMPADFAILEVHVSATTGFTPDSAPGSATLVAQLSTAGVAYATAPYGATRFVKLVAVDNSGNRSPASAQGSSATAQVVAADIFDGAVGTAELADLAVKSAKIDNGAVNDLQVGTLSVGKLSAGTLTADVAVSGRIATALTGARTEINSLGFQKFASDGVTKLIDFTGSQNLLTGTLQTATTGRRIVTGAAGTLGEISFIAPDGKTGFVRSFTESSSTGIEALQIGIQGQASDSSLWNRININSDEWMNVRSNKVDINYLTGGTFVVRQLSSRNVGATSTGRMAIDAGGTQLWSPNGATVYQLVDNGHIFYPANQATSGWIRIKPNVIADSNFRTPYIEFATDNNGVAGAGAYSSMIKFIVRTGGVNPAFQFRTGDDTAYQTIEVAGVGGSSSMKVKTDYEDFSGDPLALLRPIKLRKFRRIGQDPATPKELGVFAEEVPAEMGTSPGDDGRPTMVDLLPSLALVIGSVQQLADRLDKLEKKP